jgi:hypothetical protein
MKMDVLELGQRVAQGCSDRRPDAMPRFIRYTLAASSNGLFALLARVWY